MDLMKKLHLLGEAIDKEGTSSPLKPAETGTDGTDFVDYDYGKYKDGIVKIPPGYITPQDFMQKGHIDSVHLEEIGRERPKKDAESPKPDVFLRGDVLVVGGLDMSMQRTVRVQQGKLNSLPAGLGRFPLYAVNDYKSGTPEQWKDGTFFMPMYNHEALWISFDRRHFFSNPFAVKIGAGNINAVNGRILEEMLIQGEQDYLIVPPQPWIDGWKSPDGKVYQFVAAELGSGETVEEQITGKAEVGGIQFFVYKPRDDAKLVMDSRPNEYIESGSWNAAYSTLLPETSMQYCASTSKSFLLPRSMGLGKGGEISQKIYDDPHGSQVWVADPFARTAVYLVNSDDFRQITGREAPVSPITIATYQKLGLPWFDLFDDKKKDTPGAEIFDKLKPVSE